MNKKREVMRVRDVMKTRFDLVDGLDTVAEVLRTMKHVETKSLIVNKRHDDDEYGMVLISDIARHVLLTVSPEMDIRYCARLFTRFHLSRAPVLEDGKVIGIVSLTDMTLRGMYQDLVSSQ